MESNTNYIRDELLERLLERLYEIYIHRKFYGDSIEVWRSKLDDTLYTMGFIDIEPIGIHPRVRVRDKTMDWVDRLPIVKKSELFFSFFTYAWIKGYNNEADIWKYIKGLLTELPIENLPQFLCHEEIRVRNIAKEIYDAKTNNTR